MIVPDRVHCSQSHVTPVKLNLVSELADTAPFESPLAREWALRLAAKCSLFKSGLLAPEVDAFFPADLDVNLWTKVHRLLVSPFSGTWFREAVEGCSQRRATDGEWMAARTASRDLGDVHPISEKFISMALAVHGQPSGSCPREEKELLRMLDKERSHLFRFLNEANTRHEAQICLWLHDLGSHSKSLDRRSDTLIRLRMKLGLIPKRNPAPLLHDALLID